MLLNWPGLEYKNVYFLLSQSTRKGTSLKYFSVASMHTHNVQACSYCLQTTLIACSFMIMLWQVWLDLELQRGFSSALT